MLLPVVATQWFSIFTPKIWERWTQFDQHMFERGWFNHQPGRFSRMQFVDGWLRCLVSFPDTAVPDQPSAAWWKAFTGFKRGWGETQLSERFRSQQKHDQDDRKSWVRQAELFFLRGWYSNSSCYFVILIHLKSAVSLSSIPAWFLMWYHKVKSTESDKTLRYDITTIHM